MAHTHEALEPGRIEDLHSGPPSGRDRRWERMLGLLLVLGLAGLGGGQWWQSANRLGAYQAGARAAAGGDWEGAARAYGRAAGYGDAAARAQDATAKIAERDTQYARATAAQAQGQALVALAAIRRVQAISPAYRDSATLAAALQTEVYAAALSGAVARRPAATPPGLYVYGARGWLPLIGSDTRSRVLGRCPDGAVLFDGPGPGPPGTPPPGSGVAPGDEGLDGRRLLVSVPGAAPHAALAFDPAQFQSYACTEAGVWGATPVPDPPLPRDAFRAIPVQDAAFQAWGSPRALAPVVPSPAWRVLSISGDGRQIALIDTTEIAAVDWRARIYVANADGSARRLVFDGPGVPGATPFSADGRYLLLDLQQIPVADGQIRQSIQLLDTTGARAPRVLAAVQEWIGSYQPDAPTFGRFVQRAGHGPEALVLGPGGSGQRLRLFDVTHATAPALDVTDGPNLGLLRILRAGPAADGVVLGWQRGLSNGQTAATLLYARDGAAPQIAPLTLPAGSSLTQAWVHAGRLIVATGPTGPLAGAGPQTATLRSWPVAQFGSVQATGLYTATIGAGRPVRGANWHLGPGLLAYVTPGGELHARTYDGSADLALEPGVATFADPDSDEAP